jgi:hypothetical protein
LLVGLLPVWQGWLREPGQVLLVELVQAELTGQRLPVAFV